MNQNKKQMRNQQDSLKVRDLKDDFIDENVHVFDNLTLLGNLFPTVADLVQLCFKPALV